MSIQNEQASFSLVLTFLALVLLQGQVVGGTLASSVGLPQMLKATYAVAWVSWQVASCLAPIGLNCLQSAVTHTGNGIWHLLCT